MEKLRPGDPEHIGPYEVIARLGAGGMGVVFLGTKGAKRVAIKVVRSTFLDDPSLKTRFVREIETLQKVESPYVAKFLDSSVDGEIAWHAVEFVNGPTLKELIDSNGPMGEGDWFTFADQLRQALDSVHRLGVVHRDIKPANIIMSETGPKLIDFGISQDNEATSITSTGAVAGSPAWLAPEQLTGERLSPASDLFSAGSVLLYAATGRSPWGQETTMSVPVVYQKILSGNVDFSGLTTSQHKLVERLLNLNPEARSFDESQTPGISAQARTKSVPSSVTPQTTRVHSGRRPKVVASVLTTVVLLLGGGGLWWYFGSPVSIETKTIAAEAWVDTDGLLLIELVEPPESFDDFSAAVEIKPVRWRSCWGSVKPERLVKLEANLLALDCKPFTSLTVKEDWTATLHISLLNGENWSGTFPLLQAERSTTFERVEFQLSIGEPRSENLSTASISVQEAEVRTVRNIPNNVKQELARAIQLQITDCEKFNDDGTPSCSLLGEVEPTEQVLSGKVPDAFDSVEAIDLSELDISCGPPEDKILASGNVQRNVQCGWKITQERTYFSGGGFREGLPSVVSCDWRNGTCGGFEDKLSGEGLDRISAIPDKSRDNPEHWTVSLDCSWAGFYGYENGYDKCLVPVSTQIPKEKVGTAEIAVVWSSTITASQVW